MLHACFYTICLLFRYTSCKVATGTGMTGDDSNVPAPMPANPHTRHPREAWRGQNNPHPRQWRVPAPRRGFHGDFDVDAQAADAGVGRLWRQGDADVKQHAGDEADSRGRRRGVGLMQMLVGGGRLVQMQEGVVARRGALRLGE
jgi:hypothetical protein